MAFQRVAILGLGLIGSSMGLALRRGSAPPQVAGFDIDPQAADRASQRGAIDERCRSLAEACQGTDTIVLAAPVRGILQLLSEIAPHVQPGALVTDTGGTKVEVVRQAESLMPAHAGFVGGHPLAGRLRAGLDQPDARLFAGTLYCLSPLSTTPPWAVDQATQFVHRLGAEPYFLDPGEHDVLLAAVSHLPYFTALGLVEAVTSQDAWAEMRTVAAGGFRRMSSLVEGNPDIWADIAATNSEPLARQLDELISVLRDFRERVASGDPGLSEVLARAHSRHQEWLQSLGEAGPPEPPPPSRPARRFLFWRRS